MHNLVLIGGGGHCKAVIDVIELENKYKIVGILDIKSTIGEFILGYPIIGTDDYIDNHPDMYYIITLGDLKQRRIIYNRLISVGANIATIISPLAHVSNYCTSIKHGSVIMHHAIVNSHCKIGTNCIINTRSLIEHDAIIGDNCHISTGSILNGNVLVGNDCMIGSGAIVLQQIKIGNNSIVGAGSIVTKDVLSGLTVVGNPARNILL